MMNERPLIDVKAVGSVTVHIIAFSDDQGKTKARYCFRNDNGDVYFPFDHLQEKSMRPAGKPIRDAVEKEYNSVYGGDSSTAVNTKIKDNSDAVKSLISAVKELKGAQRFLAEQVDGLKNAND